MRVQRPTPRRGGCLLLGLLLACGSAGAVTDEEIFRDFRFNFINPGGRSLGMGGAFISIANDATAAQANPAGLTNLLEPQFFSEVRMINPDTSSTNVRFRDPFLPDEGFNILVDTDPSSQFSPSFIAYVHPVGRVWLGVSRQEVINSENRTTNTYDFLFGNGSDSRTGEGRTDGQLTNVNFSLGWKAHERLRLGATLSYGRFSLKSTIVNTYTDPTGDVIGDPALAGAQIEMYRTEADDDDTDLSLSAGLQWQLGGSVVAGAVFRQGGNFDLQETLIGQPVDPALVPGQIAQIVFFNESGRLLIADSNTYSFTNRFHTPDQWGVGLSWRPLQTLTLSLDAVRIEYSDLLDDFNSRLNVLTFGFQQEQQAAFTVDDQTNLHCGIEYLIQGARGITWALRAGFHQDKDSRIRSNFAPGGFGLGSNDNFPGRDDADHYAAGLGVVINERFQVDAAGDFSDVGTEIVASIIYSF